jgi:tetratricopeptide (TPR) repeat protein
LAQLYQDSEEDDEQRGKIGRAVELLLKAVVYHNAGWQRMAAATADEACQHLPGTLFARILVPVLWQHAGDEPRARRLVEGAAEARKECEATRHLLADFLLLDGEVGEAVARYRKAPTRGDQPLEPTLKHALLSYALGDYQAAIKAWDAAAGLQPDDVAANNNLAWALVAEPGAIIDPGRARRAIEAAKAALRQAPENPSVLDTFGWVLSRLGRPDKAVRPLQESVRRAPYRAIAHFHLGMVLKRIGRAHEALQSLRLAVALDPNASFVEEARQVINELRP